MVLAVCRLRVDLLLLKDRSCILLPLIVFSMRADISGVLKHTASLNWTGIRGICGKLIDGKGCH